MNFQKFFDFIKPFLRSVKYLFKFNYGQLSFSQEGEDLVLNRLFLNKKKGFFIDVGAHHPFRYSNTYFFYKNGWSGINIDPAPNSMKFFNKYRTKDINLEIGIAEKRDILNYYMFDEPTLNGFSLKQTNEYLEQTNFKLINTIQVDVFPLSDILKKHLIDKQVIDFLSIDVEGFDLNVLKSNDWSIYRPSIILVEDHNSNPDHLLSSEIYIYLKAQNYRFYGKTVLTFFYIDNSNGNSNFINNI